MEQLDEPRAVMEGLPETWRQPLEATLTERIFLRYLLGIARGTILRSESAYSGTDLRGQWVNFPEHTGLLSASLTSDGIGIGRGRKAFAE